MGLSNPIHQHSLPVGGRIASQAHKPFSLAECKNPGGGGGREEEGRVGVGTQDARKIFLITFLSPPSPSKWEDLDKDREGRKWPSKMGE